jgi:lysophospholipase L1-like esterase
MVSADAAERRRVLVIGDSTTEPRFDLKYRDTWLCRLKDGLAAADVIALVSGGRTTAYLAQATLAPGTATPYDPHNLETFEPHTVVLNLGIVDCAPRLFTRGESFVVGKLPGGVRRLVIAAAKRVRGRRISRAYVGKGDFERNVRQYLERCRAVGVKRVVIIAIPTPDMRARARNAGIADAAAQYNQIYGRLCREFDFATLIDPLHAGDGVCLLFIDDGYHPSARGNDAVYEALAAVLDAVPPASRADAGTS